MLPVFYSFDYKGEALMPSLERLKTSISSLIEQKCIIFVTLSDPYIFDKRINYIYRSLEPFNKGKMINYVVRTFFKKIDYLLLSDCDIIWPNDAIEHLEAMISIAKLYNFIPRIIPYMTDKENPLKNGFAPGIGLIHIPSFVSIRGYNERFVGYGGEDIEFNKRIEKINCVNEIEYIKTEHIPHELAPRDNVDKNMAIFQESMDLIKRGNIVRNGKKWGHLW